MSIFGHIKAVWLRMRLAKLEVADHAERDAHVTTNEMMEHVDARASDIVRLENELREIDGDSTYDSRFPSTFGAPTTRYEK
jgi:hypothetical protein